MARTKTGFCVFHSSDELQLCYVFRRKGETFARFPERTLPVLKRPQGTEDYILEANLFRAEGSYVRRELEKAFAMIKFIYTSRGRFDERHIQIRRGR